MKAKKEVCIKANKVYDWVRTIVDMPSIRFDQLFHEKEKEKDCPCDKGSDDPCKLVGSKKYRVHCIVTDSKGEPVDLYDKCSFLCSAKILPKMKKVKRTSSKEVIFQNVLVEIHGYFIIEIVNHYGFVVCVSNPIPFQATKTIWMCAPDGVEVNCKVTYFDCETNLICSEKQRFKSLDVDISLCVDVETIAAVKITLDARAFKARQDISPELVDCPHDPPLVHCPFIFPDK